ncbi:MAG: KGG domain-containing protein, partial [Ruthenibacterium sp.]
MDKKSDRQKKDRRDNLVSFADMPPDTQRQIASMGGKASTAATRHRKAIRDIMGCLLAQDATSDIIVADSGLAAAAQEAARERGETLDVYEAVAIAQIVRAAQGDTAAAAWVRDSAGDKPTDKMQADLQTVTSGDLALLR